MNCFRLSQSFCDIRISIDLIVKLELKFTLRLANHEVANHLGDGVTDVPQYKSEVAVNTATQISDKDIAGLRWHWWLTGTLTWAAGLTGLARASRARLSWWNRLSVCVVLLNLWFILLVLLKVLVVREYVVLLR